MDANKMAEQWVKFSDRQPEDCGNYLVVWDNSTSRKYPGMCSKIDVLYWAGKWWAPVSEEFPVTHWMPLPELPQ